MENLKEKTTCSDLGYTCTMEEHLDERVVPIYMYEERPVGGVDRRPGDTISVRVGKPIGYEIEYTAYWKCSHCGRIEKLGTKKIKSNEKKLTFGDFVKAKSNKISYEKMLADFDEKQKKARETFINQNRPKF